MLRGGGDVFGEPNEGARVRKKGSSVQKKRTLPEFERL